MVVYSFWIIGKAGGLLYQRFFNNSKELDENDSLVLASTLHSFHAIANEISPLPTTSGIVEFNADNFRILCFQSLTGIKFMAICSNNTSEIQVKQLFTNIYICYTDCILKSPFCHLDQPIRNRLLDNVLFNEVKKVK